MIIGYFFLNYLEIRNENEIEGNPSGSTDVGVL